ncbi:MAG TPA: hypothetical protein VH420_05050 [Gaiellaceae bacterium]|jgi:hypothetical protein
MSDEKQEQPEELDDLEVREDDAEDVRGGRHTPPPDGPIPIPYPN